MTIIITSPSLDPSQNVSGISSVVRFIINNNKNNQYIHFEIGKKDNEKRDFRRIIRLIKLLVNWIVLLLRQKDVIIHYNFALKKPSILRDPIFMIFTRILRKKMIIHIHGGEYLMIRKKPLWIRMILNRVFSFQCSVIVLSDYEKMIIEKDYKSKKIFSLPNCIDLPDDTPLQRGNDKAMLSILFLGRITESKGIKDIYNALKILNDEKIDFIFKIAGQGDLKFEYIAKFQNLLHGKFEYLGVIFGSRKKETIKESDIFILPSVYGEGLPIALLECMSYGNVPIVTQDGSIGQFIKDGENGLIVRKSDPDNIAQAIKMIYYNRNLLLKLSINARTFIFDNFNPISYTNKLNSIYLEE